MFGLDSQILIADDSDTCLENLKVSLNEIGFTNIDMALNGDEALNLLKNDPGKYKIIISDLNMPIMDGIQLLKHIQGDEALMEIPFIMVTAEGEKETILDALFYGVNEYLVKPFVTEELKAKLKSAYDLTQR